MTLDVTYLPTLNVLEISQDGCSVYIRRDQTTELLDSILRAVAETIANSAPDTWSRKVPDTPGLRLVGGD